MTIRVYNSLSRQKEAFEPIEPGRVNMYVCGPTVYDSSHMGHARSVVVFDVIARYFRAAGYRLVYVRNFTDVDDKIIDRANQLGISCSELADRYIAEFYRDMDALYVQRADHEPRATEFIDHMIQVIRRLEEKGVAYPIDGDVYFAVEKFADYGKLSGRRLEDMEAGARVEVDDKKRNPFDFALWKSAKPGEPAWDSPWGKGRPGWHIECSAMSSEYLGQSFDIHGGGKDLIFPHHENEIAQSEAAFDRPFAKYWIHNGFVNIDQEKMSKSLGNFLMIKDVLKTYHPEALRLFLLSNHYRSPVDFTDQALDEATAGLDKIYTLLDRIATADGMAESGSDEPPGDSWTRFCGAMDDDFNTAKGIGILFETVRNLNRSLDECRDAPSEDERRRIRSERDDIRRIGGILGILNAAPAEYLANKRVRSIEKKSIDPAQIDRLIDERIAARKAKDWERADAIRQELQDLDILLEDKPDGTTVWKVKE